MQYGRRLAAVASLALIAGCGGGNASPTPAPQTLTGTLLLIQEEQVKWPDSGGCLGTGGYADIHGGTDVVVRDESDDIVATTPLVALPRPSEGLQYEIIHRCWYTFALTVPDAPFYSVAIGSREPLVYSRADMAGAGWTVDLTLGN